jgi:hypothetical protein
LNLYIETYVIIYIDTHTHTHIYSDRENKIVLVSLSEGAMGGGREKENVTEWKILNQPIYI